MRSIILQEARKFLVEYLNRRECGYETIYPWRKNWEFVVYHSLRVESYVVKILKGEEHNLAQDEIEILRAAAILHDIGRIHGNENHGKKGRVIVEKWIKENKLLFEKRDINKLLYMIETHSNKDIDEKDFSINILKDADILDEIGVLSIFMAANRVDKNSYLFFDELLDRVKKYEINYCNDKMEELRTITAKMLLKKKKEFIELFTTQLEDELSGREFMEKLI